MDKDQEIDWLDICWQIGEGSRDFCNYIFFWIFLVAVNTIFVWQIREGSQLVEPWAVN